MVQLMLAIIGKNQLSGELQLLVSPPHESSRYHFIRHPNLAVFVLPPVKSGRYHPLALPVFPRTTWDKYMKTYREKHRMLYNLQCYFGKDQEKP